MSGHATAQRTRPPVNQLALLACNADQATETWPGEIGCRRMRNGPGSSPAAAIEAAGPRPKPQPLPIRSPGQTADRGGTPALTPRLAEIIASMVEAVLDADTSDSSAIRGKVRTARCRQRDPGATGPFGGRR
jgi:hypothetical protein